MKCSQPFMNGGVWIMNKRVVIERAGRPQERSGVR